MQSKNPVFARNDQFNGRGGYAGFGQAPPADAYGQAPDLQQGYGLDAGSGRMTIDSVVQKTGMTLGLVVLVAAATWLFTGEVRGDATDSQVLGTLSMLSMVGALGAFVLSLVNSFKKVISPPLVLAFAALEGVFVGAFSKLVSTFFGGAGGGMELVGGAVLGTIGAVAGTLAAYKFFNIQVGTKFRKWVVAMMFGFVAVSLLDFVLGFFQADFGFNGFGTMGLISSFIGLGIGVLMLILDFDYVERGIAAGLPERESWRAAFGLTVTIVWIYIEILRILAILRGND